MRIKTREALRNIKKVDRAEILAQKTKGGISNLQNIAEHVWVIMKAKTNMQVSTWRKTAKTMQFIKKSTVAIAKFF